MNKLPLLSLCFAAITSIVDAQVPTLTNANVSPSLNDSFLTVVADETGVMQGASGAGVTWNFGTLSTKGIADSVSIGNVIYANTASSYSGLALAASLIPSATFATSTHAVVSPTSAFTTYYIGSVAKLSTSAIYYSSTANSLYTDPMDVFQFPFTFGSNFVDAYAGFVTYGSATMTQSGSASVNADGWGTLILPPAPPSTSTRTFTGVLRVHGYQLFKDSVNVFGGGVIYDTIETYTWYQPGYHSALLTISTVKNTLTSYKVVSYARKQLANHQAVSELDGVEATLKLYPNPANSFVHISFNTSADGPVKISLVDVLGREAAVIADHEFHGEVNLSYNTTALSKGLYLVRVQSGEETITRKLEVQ